MKVSSKQIMDRFCLSVFVILTLLSVECRAVETEREFVPIRIGWQMPAATQGQIVQVLKRTNVLEAHGLDPSLIPFSYGGPQVEAAFAGELDVVFSGDQPAINLIARGGKWKIVARLYADRVATITPTGSSIRALVDLKGKTVASAFGSVGQRDTVLQQRAAGLDPNVDVSNKNVDILEISHRVLAGGVESWGEIDAAVVWEPLLSRLRLKGLARVLTSKPSLGVVSISDDFVNNHPEAAAQFLVALIRAWEFLARDPDSVMQWYVEDTQLDYTPNELIAARLDRNFGAGSLSEIDMNLRAEHIATLEQGAAWGRTVGTGDAWTSGSVNKSLLARAQQIISADTFEDIEIFLPSSDGSALISNEYHHLFDSVPIAVVFAFMVLIALLAIEVGLWLGKRGKKHLDDLSLQPIATVVGAVLGLMAFVIALTFGSANSRFDERKSALLEDVTTIQTAYLRASLLPEPHRTTVRSLLRDYVHMRVGIVYAYGFPERLELVQRRAESLQRLMWAHVESLSDTQSDSRIQLLFATALNDVFNQHTKRVVLGAYYQIPVFVWIALLVASTLAMFAVGYQFGASGGRRIPAAKFALSLTFALVMLLAIDLDRTGEGLVAVNQQPMLNLYRSMNAGK
ncbi:MAG: NrtA/SsuA/CpmA family ABC transporter substrate-binding protein [Halioglobus sp.]